MDLHTIARFRSARTRADLALAPGEQLLAGGTWVFSEPQVEHTGLVDLTTMAWPALEFPAGGGLRIGATCTIAELAQLAPRPGWSAQRLFVDCAGALLQAPAIWASATVGGNICRAYAAASMVSLAVALDGTALIWQPDGGKRTAPVAELISGDASNTLAFGEVLRAVDLPEHALRARVAFRQIALATLGRSGAVVIGRVDPDGAVALSVTAATQRPAVLRYPSIPDAAALRRDAAALPGYYTDPLGAADWRRAVTAVLLDEVRAELAG